MAQIATEDVGGVETSSIIDHANTLTSGVEHAVADAKRDAEKAREAAKDAL